MWPLLLTKKSKKSQSTQTKGGKEERKEVLRGDKLRHAINKCYSIFSTAGWTGGGLEQAWLLHPVPQRYGRAKFDKVKSHLPENSAEQSPCRTEMNFSSASFDFSPKIKSSELWHRMRSVWDHSFFPFFFLSFLSFLISCLFFLPSSYPLYFLFILLSILSFYFIPSISLSIMQTFFLPFLSSLLPRLSVLSISLSSYSSSFPCFCLSFLFSTLPHLFICFSFPPFLLFHSFGISQWNLLSLSPCLHFISLFWSHRSEVNHLQTNSISQSQISRCCCQNSSASNKTHTQDETDLNQQKIYVHSCKSVNQVADKASPHLINAVYWTEIHFFQLWLHFSRFLLAILGTSFEQLTVKVCLWIQVQQFVIEKHPLNCLLCMFETRIHSMIINHLFAGVKRIEKIREMQKVHVGLVYAFVCMS